MENNMILEGFIASDIRKNTTNKGASALGFTMVHIRDYKVGGEKKNDFIVVSAYSSLADELTEKLQKGTRILVTGQLKTRDHLNINAKNIEVIAPVIPKETEPIEDEMSEPAKPTDSESTE